VDASKPAPEPKTIHDLTQDEYMNLSADRLSALILNTSAAAAAADAAAAAAAE